MKTCYSCSSKPTKNGVYKSELENFIYSQLPKDNTHYHKIGASSRLIEGLKPNTCIFYFGTSQRSITLPLKKFEDAYGKLKNSGVTRTDSKGKAKFFLDCPQVYKSLSGNVHERHLHYLYWNEKSASWNHNLYTQPIICEVNENYVKKYMNKSLVIDALPEQMYNKRHIKGAYNLPVDKRTTEEKIKKIVKNRFNKSSKHIPIIIYCYFDGCDAAEKVLKRLNKLGYNNIVHYKKGIKSWKGPIETN